ncbi:MAG: hypothetical protein ACLUJG_11925 [Lawsonibacter sp.]
MITSTGALVGVVSEVGLNRSTVSTVIDTRHRDRRHQVTRTYSAGMLEETLP